MNDQIDEPLTLYSIVEYVSENFIGLTLLIFTFLIIYVVDHINNLNSIMMSPQIPVSKLHNPLKVKSKKLKKH
jgi:hypothetical protein